MARRKGFRLPIFRTTIVCSRHRQCMHIQMQIRYPNISFLFSSQSVLSSGEARDDRCFTCLYSAITSFLHHEYSIHSHVGMHILYAARFMCSERFIFHSLAEHSGFLFVGSVLAGCYCCCDCFSSFYDSASYGTLSTGFFILRSSLRLVFWYEHFWCLIILIKMLFLEGVESWKQKKTLYIFFFVVFLYLASRWFIKTQKASHAITFLSTRTLLSLFANREKLKIIFDL